MKTLSCWLIAGMTLLASLNSVAQPANEGGQGGRQGRQGGQRGGRGGMMMGRGGLMQYDTNGDLQVSEQELVDGVKGLQEKLNKLKPFLLSEFDADKDGKLNKEEGTEARNFFMSLMGLPRVDTDGDWTLSDKEAEDALTSLAEMSDRYSEMMIRRYDTDKDGKLSEEEVAAAKKKMEEQRSRGGRRGGRNNRGGGNREGGGNR